MIAPFRHDNLSPIAIAFEGRRARILQRVGRRRSPARVLTATVELPAHPDTAADAALPAIAEALRAALKRGDFTARQCVSCLPASQVLYRRLFTSPMPTDELRAAVHWQLAKDLDIPPERLRATHHVVAQAQVQGRRRLEVIAVGALASDVDRHAALLVQAGLTPIRVETFAGAIACALAANPDDPAPALVIAAPAPFTPCLALRGGRIAFARTIQVRPHCSSDPLTTTRDQAHALAREVAATLQFLADVHPDEPLPSRAVIASNSEGAAALADDLRESTALRVIPCHEALSADLAPLARAIDPQELPGWLPALGLAAPRSDAPSADLLATDDQAAATTRSTPGRRRIALAAGVAALATAWALTARAHLASLDARIDGSRDEVARLTREREQADVLHAEHAALQARTRTLDAIPSPVPTADLVALIAQLIPDGVYLEALTIAIPPLAERPDDAPLTAAIRIEGDADRHESVSTLADRMLQHPALRRVRLEAGDAAPSSRFVIAAEMPLERARTRTGEAGP